ncbi:hypothetical protein V498_06002 [Pseudogymnoascus sp. VKM F-4517 (FW-2822)]|nr:hypothetical protein V498_06002 [Pseudogymnoascus sp. VKM F-4517 (FW-2822)]
MSTSNPDSLRCPKELELQSASGDDLQALGSPKMGVPVTAKMVAPCVGSEPEKDTQSHAITMEEECCTGRYIRRGILLDSGYNYHSDRAG